MEVLADDALEGREAGSRGGQAAAKYLALLFEKYELEPAGTDGSYFQPFGEGYRNLLGMLKGTDPQLGQEIIVIGAHYDHVGYGSRRNSFGPYGAIHNGADDNASGTSSVLELIEAFYELGVRPRRSILFCLWDGEEKGLLGSKHWLRQPTVALEQVKFSINLDMIGRLRNEGLSVYGERTSKGLRTYLSRQNQEGLKLAFNWDLKPDSDHYPFVEHRIPTVMMHTGLHNDYHRPSDDVETLNFQGMQEVSRYVARVTWELANDDESFAFRDEAWEESESNRREFERSGSAFPTRLGITLGSGGMGDGLTIDEVLAGSPAEQAGLASGRTIVSANEHSALTEEDFWDIVFAAEREIVLNVRDSGGESQQAIHVVLGGRPLRIGLSWRIDPGQNGVALVSRVCRHSRADRSWLNGWTADLLGQWRVGQK